MALGRPDAPLSGVDLTVLSGIRGINMILLLGSHRAFNTAKLPTANQLINTAEVRENRDQRKRLGRHSTPGFGEGIVPGH